MTLFAVGPHRFQCADALEDPTGLFLPGEMANLTYTDPPWNSGISKVFRTWTENAGGTAAVPSSFSDVLAAAVHLVKQHSAGHVFVEMGNQHFETLVNLLMDAGAAQFHLFDTTYSSPPKPMKLWWGTFADSVLPVGLNFPANLHAWGPSKWIGEWFAKEGELFYDPFVGLGGMTKMALRHNMIIRGMEFNPQRLLRTMQMVSNKTGVEIRECELE